ncbi:MAG: NmrA family NAD(P)-binding protein, partial [Acidobacteriota bacterium]
MRVTVCGASGGVGRYVAEALAWSEHEVRVVTRDA